MYTNLMVFTFRTASIPPDEFESHLPLGDMDYILEMGVTDEHNASGKALVFQAQVRWLYMVTDFRIRQFAEIFTDEHDVQIQHTSRAEKEGLWPHVYQAGSPNHLMPDGVNPPLPAVRKYTYDRGQCVSEIAFEETWTMDDSLMKIEAMKVLSGKFDSLTRLVSASERTEDRDGGRLRKLEPHSSEELMEALEEIRGLLRPILGASSD